jgi:diaminopimelate epimerase
VPRDGDVTVDMGRATLPDLAPVQVTVDGESSWPARAVDVGNPHAVVLLDDLAAAGPLRLEPVVRPEAAFPSGVNVEFAVPVGPRHYAMRVHERGVGETQSCGTGAVAVVVAAGAIGDAADRSTGWVVDVPGGRLLVTVRDDGGIDLTGPADLVAEGTLEAAWVDAHRHHGRGS